MSIEFNEIPSNLEVPGFYPEFGKNAASTDTRYSLLIGQTITEADATPVWIGSVSQAIKDFGKGSTLTAMVQRYLATDPSGGLLYVLPLAAADAAVAATGAIEFTGPATAAGTLELYIAGRLVEITVSADDTAATIAKAVAAKVNAYVDDDGVILPVSAAVDAADTARVDLTALNHGSLGNNIDVRFNYYGARGGEVTPSGVGFTITAMSGGAADPDLSTIATMLGDNPYEFIGCPWSSASDLNYFKTVLDDRWTYVKQIYGHVYTAKPDSDITGATNQTFATARNNKHETIITYEPSPLAPWDVVAGWLGATAKSSRNDPARPLQTLVLKGLIAPPKASRYTLNIRNALLQAGAALMDYNDDGTVKILRSVTSYKTNSDGATDKSWHDSETCHLVAEVVRTLKTDYLTAYPRAKLVDDGTDFGAGVTFTDTGEPDQTMVTPKMAKATLQTSAKSMVKKGWLNGMPDITVERNTDDASRLDVSITLYLASGLRVTAMKTTFSLGTRS